MQFLVLIVTCFALDDCSLAFDKNKIIIIQHWIVSMLTYHNTQCRQICVEILLSLSGMCCAEVLQKLVIPRPGCCFYSRYRKVLIAQRIVEDIMKLDPVLVPFLQHRVTGRCLKDIVDCLGVFLWVF